MSGGRSAVTDVVDAVMCSAASVSAALAAAAAADDDDDEEPATWEGKTAVTGWFFNSKI